ncbi:MAG: hypothetical protein KJP20_02490, partial [Bacteroidia bacterium]|nr:hypothetical protein [Bacteroidia bacterium]
MVNITFKNVGQGDSILLEWEEDGRDKIGIIDCNQVNASINPVLDYIIKSKITEIEFILMSHPHKDHYSGLYDLIDHCDKNQVKIHRFLHTGRSSIDYWLAASRGITQQKKIIKLYELLIAMRKAGKLEMNDVDDNPWISKSLPNGFKLEFLAPSANELDNYTRGVKFPFDEEGSTSKPNGNWLSTIIKIYNENTSVLLTSDVDSKVLKRLNKRKGRLKEQKSILAQIPHHGSDKNMDNSFWSGLRRYNETFAVISVGDNSYGHPSKSVVDFFNNHPDYVLERTDQNIITSREAQKNSILLDLVSQKTDQNTSSSSTNTSR